MMRHHTANRWYSSFTHHSTDQLLDLVVLNQDSDDELVCIGYRKNGCKLVLFYILVFLTLGLLLLVMYWKPAWAIKLKKSRCALVLADTVLLRNEYGKMEGATIFTKEVKHDRVITRPETPSTVVIEDDTSSCPADETVALMTDKSQQQIFKYFDYQHIRYFWDKDSTAFKRLHGLESNLTCETIHDTFTGLTPTDEENRLEIYGENSIEVKVKSYFRLFVEEVLNPFYIFQICSVTLWSIDEYYVYASCIVLISGISLGIELYETRKQSETLSSMVSTSDQVITVCQKGEHLVEVPTKSLVPGDVIVMPAKGCIMPCDAILLSGNCIVNESMLTGESVPVTKTPITPSEADEIYNPDIHKRHTLFNGTHVIQTRYYGDAKVKAVVARTGFSTAKGELVRAILFPKPVGFKFYQDAMKFIGFLACIASLGMAYTIYTMISEGAETKRIILRSLDIITIVVPPALPAAMTVGMVYAQGRLKKKGIFCISPPRINMCGKMKLVCFDKTGTLTEDGLDMWGVVPIQENRFLHVVQNPTDLTSRGPFLAAMATCHSLTIIDGELTGDPLDMKMFNSTNWVLEEPGSDTSKFDSLMPTVVRPRTNDTHFDLELPDPFDFDLGQKILEEPGRDSSKFDNLIPTVVRPTTREAYGSENDSEAVYEIGIVKQFTFSSSLQRMSVVARVLGLSHMDVYAKGAPEKIALLCKKETVPEDFHDVLQKYTMKGFRVIALAWKPLKNKVTWHQVQRISRDVVESELNFLGLLIMENTLKPQTTPVIHQLNDADIRTVMVTGDNMLTAVSVARQCGMVKPKDHVILVKASPPDNKKLAQIEWEYTDYDPFSEEEPEEGAPVFQSDPELTEFGNSVNISVPDERVLYQTVDIEDDKPIKFHFAVTGKSFGVLRQYFPELMPKICVRGTVFARMSPDQKSQLVEHLQEIDYIVGMCGDGANDCGALKTAHAGISLSEAEASVASPFTSKIPNIECVPTVIKEGRAALTTSFGVFKYMALYSMIQFVSVLILYSLNSNLGDWMYLYVDLAITTVVAVLMGYTAAYTSIVSKRPPGSLVALINVLSILMHIALVVAFQVGAFGLLTIQPWYQREKNGTLTNSTGEQIVAWSTTVVFLVSSFQYIILAFCFSTGPPYRRPIWTNWLFLVSLLILTGFTTMLLLHPFPFLVKLLQLKRIPSMIFCGELLAFAAGHFILACTLESIIVNCDCLKGSTKKCRGKKDFKNKFKRIERDIQNDLAWPPVGDITISTISVSVADNECSTSETSHVIPH